MNNEILYSSCPCGSGNKFKFCCYKTHRGLFDKDMTMSDVVAAIRGLTDSFTDSLPDDCRAEDLLDDGRDLMRCGDLIGAREKLKYARTEYPTLAMAWNNEASCAWMLGDIEGAYQIQCEGNTACKAVNVFGLASQSVYAKFLGRDSESLECLEKAKSMLPLNHDMAERVCYALSFYRRHQEILDYIDNSGFADDPSLLMYYATALLNLGRKSEARRYLLRAVDSKFYILAEEYRRLVDEECYPLSVYEDWPYNNTASFPLARTFRDMIRNGQNPVEKYPYAAPEALNILLADYTFEEEKLLPLVDCLTHKEGVEFRKKLKELSESKIVEEEVGHDSSEGGPEPEDDDSLLDDAERARVPFACYLDTMGLREDFSDAEVELLERVGQLDLKNIPADRSEYDRLENALYDMTLRYPESFHVLNLYVGLVRTHDKVRGADVWATFYHRHEDDVAVAARQIVHLVQDGKEGEAFAIMNRFRLPRKKILDIWICEWFGALAALALVKDVKSRFPEYYARLELQVKAYDELQKAVQKAVSARTDRSVGT